MTRTRPDVKTDTSEPPAGTGNPLRTLKHVFENTLHVGRPKILDMGPACSSNIEFFGQRGFKVYVEDFLNDYLPVAGPQHSEDPLLGYPPATFDGILCWDVFDFISPEDGESLIQKLFALLKAGGLILALFDARTPPQTKHLVLHKIVGEDQVVLEAIKEKRAVSRHYQNREIIRLFYPFEIVKSYYHKNSVREYLFQKLSTTIS